MEKETPQTDRTRPEPFSQELRLEAFTCISTVLGRSLDPSIDPYDLMKAIEECPVIGDLQSSAVNGGAKAASLMILGAMLATIMAAAVPEDPNVPGVRDLGPKPLETPPIADGGAEVPGPTPEGTDPVEVPGPTPGGTIPQEPDGEPADGAEVGAGSHHGEPAASTGEAAAGEGEGEPLPGAPGPEKKAQEPSTASSEPSGQ